MAATTKGKSVKTLKKHLVSFIKIAVVVAALGYLVSSGKLSVTDLSFGWSTLHLIALGFAMMMVTAFKVLALIGLFDLWINFRRFFKRKKC